MIIMLAVLMSADRFREAEARAGWAGVGRMERRAKHQFNPRNNANLWGLEKVCGGAGRKRKKRAPLAVLDH